MDKRYRFAALGLILWLGTACGGDAPPTPTPTATAAPPTATVAAVPPTATALLTPTVATTGTLPATQVVTSTMGVTLSSSAAPDMVTSTLQTAGAPCSIEADLDLAGYPDLELKLGCALSAATFDRVGINEFGEGPDFDRFMLWFEAEQQIYVLRPEGNWQAHPDTWSEEQPEFPCNPLGGEESSPPLPRRGFGKLWCSDPEIQTTMGTVAREERACQHSVTQRFTQGRLVACYEDATIRYIRLLEDGRWDSVLAQ